MGPIDGAGGAGRHRAGSGSLGVCLPPEPRARRVERQCRHEGGRSTPSTSPTASAKGEGFIRLTLISFALTLGVILAGICAIAADRRVPGARPASSASRTLAAVLVQWLRWPLLLLALLLGLAVLYRFGPQPDRAALAMGHASAAMAARGASWLAGSAALSLYLLAASPTTAPPTDRSPPASA